MSSPRAGGSDQPQHDPGPRAGQSFIPPPRIPQTPPAIGQNAAADAAANRLPMGLESFEDLAEQNNPTLQQARAQVQGTLGEAIQAGLWPNPTVYYIQDQIAAKGSAGEFLGGAVQQEFITAHKRQLSRAKYLVRAKVSEWIALAQQYQVLNDVRMHYFRTLGRQEIVQIQRELLKNFEDRAVTTRELYNEGQARMADLHQANYALQQQRLAVLMAENDQREAWQELNALSGVSLPLGALQGGLEAEGDAIEWNDVLQRLLIESPQIRIARTQLEANRIQVERELVEPVPNIFVRAGGGQNFEVSPNQAVATAAVFMQVPIWNRNEGTVRQARADVARQQQEVRRIELQLQRELAPVYRQYLTALQTTENYRDVILPEARAAYEILLESYKVDRVAWMDVLDAQRNYYLLRATYVAHLIQLREAEVLIIGYLLSDGLAAPARPFAPNHINVSPQPR